MSKDMRYSTSPLLAERTPMWRSRFIMLALAAGGLALLTLAIFAVRTARRLRTGTPRCDAERTRDTTGAACAS